MCDLIIDGMGGLMLRYYCTYFDKNYLVKGLALIHSLIKHESVPFSIYVVCLDDLTQTVLNSLNIREIVTIPLKAIEAGDAELSIARMNRTSVEYFWTLTPTIILRILQTLSPGEVLTYLDADLFFFSSPQPIFDEFCESAVLIHEHRFPASLKRHEVHGKYNVGLMSFRATAEGFDVLNWWRQRCNEWCYDRVEDGKYGDQRYLDDWPDRFSKIHVLQQISAGVAPWNNIQYAITNDISGTPPLVNGKALIFYHFHALEFYCPTLVIVSKHAVYPLSESVLNYCYYPYLLAINEAISKIRQIVPGFSEGLNKDNIFQPWMTFIAPKASAEIIRNAGINHRVIQLDDTWECYCSSQVIAKATMDDFSEQNAEVENQADVVVIGTSIAPNKLEKQLAAIKSWCQLGFQVISVNSAEEVLKLHDIFPMVKFEIATVTGKKLFGRPLIYLDDVLCALFKSGSKVCGIINSDIVLYDCQQLTDFLKKYTLNTLIYGKRVDVVEIGAAQGTTYCYGRDYFFFDSALIPKIPKSEFCLGAPWWDIWMPLAAKHVGFNLIQPLERFALHEKHSQAWDFQSYIVSFSIFNQLMFKHEFEISKDDRFFDAVKSVISNKSDTDIMHLILDYLASNTLAYSIKISFTNGLIIYDNFNNASNPSITFVITDINLDTIYIPSKIISIEQQRYFNKIEIVIILNNRKVFHELFDFIITIRNQYRNILFVLSEPDTINNMAIINNIASGKYILKVDELQVLEEATDSADCISADNIKEPLNQFLSYLDRAYSCE